MPQYNISGVFFAVHFISNNNLTLFIIFCYPFYIWILIKALNQCVILPKIDTEMQLYGSICGQSFFGCLAQF